MFTKEMQDALKADGEKLEQQTGEYHGPEFEYDDDLVDSAEEAEWWAEMQCSQDAQGQCGQAGSEYCEFECPFRDQNEG